MSKERKETNLAVPPGWEPGEGDGPGCGWPRPLARRAIFALTSGDCFGEKQEERRAVGAAVTHGAVNHTGGSPGDSEPLATSAPAAAAPRRDLMGVAEPGDASPGVIPAPVPLSFHRRAEQQEFFTGRRIFFSLFQKENVGCSVPRLTSEPRPRLRGTRDAPSIQLCSASCIPAAP